MTDLSASPATRDETIRLRLEDYLGAARHRRIRISGLRQYSSGYSWITYGFCAQADGGEPAELILRIGPGNGLYAPYSAEPEFAALEAVRDSAVPAPRPLHWSNDTAIFGDPFLIVEKIAGTAPIPWGDDGLGDAKRAALGAQFAEAMGHLHAIDWRGTGLAKFGADLTLRNAAMQQVELWVSNYRRWALRSHPMLHRVFAWLRANAPEAPSISIIHGDYRLGNFLEVDGRITAILDWELVHLGDPHEDLAWICLPQYRGGTPLMCKLIGREELYARHERLSGHPVDENSMRFYTLFSLVKLAITHIAAAYAFERNGFHDLRMAAMGTQVAPTLRQIEKMLESAA
jgi:aminoglycoside phosphotransferase (APT) family kinase protein